MAQIKILFVTIPPDAADDFVQTLTRERFVACGNVFASVRSHFWWEGKVTHEPEAVVLMETSNERLDAAIERVRELHPYEVPKVVALDPDRVNADYVAWAIEETRPRT